jgi:hypothetical protein
MITSTPEEKEDRPNGLQVWRIQSFPVSAIKLALALQSPA